MTAPRVKPDAGTTLSVALAAVIGTRGVLLIRRRKEPFAEHWGLPGGKVGFGEHLDDAVRREVMEETGVRTEFKELCGVVTEKVYERNRLARHYILMVCRLVPRSTRLRASGEGVVGWFGLKELAGLNPVLIPSDAMILRSLVLNRLRQRFYRCVVRHRAGRYRVAEYQ